MHQEETPNEQIPLLHAVFHVFLASLTNTSLHKRLPCCKAKHVMGLLCHCPAIQDRYEAQLQVIPAPGPNYRIEPMTFAAAAAACKAMGRELLWPSQSAIGMTYLKYLGLQHISGLFRIRASLWLTNGQVLTRQGYGIDSCKPVCSWALPLCAKGELHCCSCRDFPLTPFIESSCQQYTRQECDALLAE